MDLTVSKYMALFLCAAALASCFERRTPKNDEGQILLDINVNYRLAYRDRTWVPVDVIASNTERDVAGRIELRTYTGDELQSPIYVLPAQSPKDSNKRFRFHCRLDNTTRIEAMLYHGNRPALVLPASIIVKPVNPEDLFGLVIDKEPADYGFLNMVFTSGEESTRFYREEVSQETIGLLADFPQCYDPYDVIIIGNIDPNRIGERHRALLERYVMDGGMLVVCAGSNAALLRGSWLEALAAIAVGPAELSNDADIAARVFAEPDRAGVRPERQGQFAQLTPAAPEVRVRGEQGVLATVRPIGNGYVAAIAVDAASRLLQDTVGYKRLWRELCGCRRYRGDLSYVSATQHYIERIPEGTGIRLFSRTAVLRYLGLYFAAVIVNWILWNYLKRREISWIFLVVLSFGFTFYAVVYGTAGRAKSSRLNQIEFLRVGPHGGASQITSLVSLLSARSVNLEITLPNKYTLAEDLSAVNPMNIDYRSRRERPPFYAVQSEQPKLERFLVGASELRMFALHSEIQAVGGIEGTLAIADGVIQGTLENRTGLKLRSASVYIDGARYPAQVTPEGISIDLAGFQGKAVTTDPPNQSRGRATRPYGPLLTESAIHSECLDMLFQVDAFEKASGLQLSPLLVAEVEGSPLAPLLLDKAAESIVSTTYLIADIEVDAQGIRRTVSQDLLAKIEGERLQVYAPLGSADWFTDTYEVDPPSASSVSVEIQLPFETSGATQGDIDITVSCSASSPVTCQFVPRGAQRNWPNAHRTHSQEPTFGGAMGYSVRRPSEAVCVTSESYRFSDWRQFQAPDTGMLAGTVYFSEPQGADSALRVSLRAKLQTPLPFAGNEDWKPWPSSAP